MGLFDLQPDVSGADPKMKVCREPGDLPDFSGWKRFVLDCETTSFDDDQMALEPYEGHRICGFAVSQGDGTAWYVPMRHHNGKGPSGKIDYSDCGNLPLEPVQAWLRDLFARTDVEWCNHNLKFDWHFLIHDGVEIKCRVADTMVLGRLVENNLPALSLDYIGKWLGFGGKEGKDEVARYLDSIKSKDFGRVPVRIMARYAVRDARLTYMVRKALEERLPDFSKDLWETEKKYTTVLATMEQDGVHADEIGLKTDWCAALERLIATREQIDSIAGWEVNPGSAKDLTELLVNQMGIKPKEFTENGAPSWNKAALENLVVPDELSDEAKQIGKLIRGHSYLQHFTGQYLEGWITRLDERGYLHSDMKQAGTRTGRLSSSDPNIQNIPAEAERGIICPAGHVIIGFDFSQVEYRVFAHYTKDPNIMGPYLSDPDADFHQGLADVLGTPRQFAKTLNFSMLYGMGKAKLLLSLMAVMSVLQAEKGEEMERKLRDLVYVSGLSMAENAGAYIKEEAGMRALAEKIYDDYHKRFPSIREFATRVKDAASYRQYVRNLYGRRYTFDMSQHDDTGKRKYGPHRAVNYLIQGSCADLLRVKMNLLHSELRGKYNARMFTTVHDSVYTYVPRDAAPHYYRDAKRILEDCPEIGVPIRVDGKVATRNMDAYVDIDESGGRAASVEQIVEALTAADAQPNRSKSLIELSEGYRVGRHGV